METTAAPLPATSTALLDSPRMAPPSASVDRGTRIPPERRHQRGAGHARKRDVRRALPGLPALAGGVAAGSTSSVFMLPYPCQRGTILRIPEEFETS